MPRLPRMPQYSPHPPRSSPLSIRILPHRFLPPASMLSLLGKLRESLKISYRNITVTLEDQRLLTLWVCRSSHGPSPWLQTSLYAWCPAAFTSSTRRECILRKAFRCPNASNPNTISGNHHKDVTWSTSITRSVTRDHGPTNRQDFGKRERRERHSRYRNHPRLPFQRRSSMLKRLFYCWTVLDLCKVVCEEQWRWKPQNSRLIELRHWGPFF